MTDAIDWSAVVDEVVRRRKEEGLTQRQLAALAGVSTPTVNAFEQGETKLQFERVISILEAVNLFTHAGRNDDFDGFIRNARRRWEALTSSLADDHPSRQHFGHSEQSYAISGLERNPSLASLRDILADIPPSSGWPPFWIPTRSDLAPHRTDGGLECWLGKPDTERHFHDTAHSDYWLIDSAGQAYLQRGYQEDGAGNLEPGTIFDISLPIWRTAEVLFHAAALAETLGASADSTIRYVARYTGLEGRELVSWAKPTLRLLIGERHRARSSEVAIKVETNIQTIRNGIEALLDETLAPLYERFDGYRLPRDLISNEVADLRSYSR